MSLQTQLEQSWIKPNGLTLLLRPLSWLYLGLFKLRALLYKVGFLSSYQAPLPVIVVGNLTVGGTGKTPLVIYLIEQLRRQGFNPGVISRGYGGQAPNYPYFVALDSPAAHSGDEPALIVRRTQAPMVVGANRQQSITMLMQQSEVDIIISDDGLQHLALQRSLEICVLDQTSPQDNTYLFPAGPYREPSSRLNSVDLVVQHGASGDANLTSGQPTYAMNLVADAPKQVSSTADNGQFDNTQAIHAVAGIGNPQRFFATCQALGYDIKPRTFPDHHAFSQADIDLDGQVLMTEKDAVKCQSIVDSRHWYLPVDAKLSADFNAALTAFLAKLNPSNSR